MTTDKITRIGIVGTGNIGKVHIRTFKKVPNAEIIAVTDVNLEGAHQTAQEFGIQTVYESPEQMIQDKDIDAIIIGAPNKFHASLAIQGLKAGKHLLIEKPMAINLKEAKQIVKAQQEFKKTVMISHQMRWEWSFQLVKQQVEKGALGQIYNAKTGWFRRKGIPGWGTWFTKSSESGGGPLIDIGVHMIDLALYLMGNPKPVSVYGSTYAEFGPKKRGIGMWGTPNWEGTYDVEDLATALIKMDNGSTLSLDVSWAVHMDTDNEPFIHLMGSEGGASIVGKQTKLLTEVFDKPAEVELTKPNNYEDERVQLSKHFIQCIQENIEPISNVMSGFTNNLILEAIYESSRTGNEVKLDWNI